ncbi:unnamed protein product [Fraxinus pennsylvanica]|uniref:Uncharacterized protein n=1 Tax=Fraxinus pennsylvanica TaxID=56036 RepID=A0AAD2DLI7_9LAMI|nr:unnamed protein product [Fraxinus pennsylvanica]
MPTTILQTRLQKFKLMASECVVAGSPTMSPVMHIRRRKTLRMLLSHGGGGGRRLPVQHDDWSSDQRGNRNDGISLEKRKKNFFSHKLKDLFASSPPALDERVSENVKEEILPPFGGGVRRRDGARWRRPGSALFRRRLLRRAWRPVLVTIPE